MHPKEYDQFICQIFIQKFLNIIYIYKSQLNIDNMQQLVNRRESNRVEIRKLSNTLIFQERRKLFFSESNRNTLIEEQQLSFEEFNNFIQTFQTQSELNTLKTLQTLKKISFHQNYIPLLCSNQLIVFRLCEFLSQKFNNYVQVQNQASWVLANLTSCSDIQSYNTLLSFNIVAALVSKICLGVDLSIKFNCIWSINNILISNSNIGKQLILNTKYLLQIQNFLNENPTEKQIYLTLSTLYKLIQSADTQITYKNFRKLPKYLFQLLLNSDAELIYISVLNLYRLLHLKYSQILWIEIKNSKILKRLLYLFSQNQNQKTAINIMKIIDKCTYSNELYEELEKFQVFLPIQSAIHQNSSENLLIEVICTLTNLTMEKQMSRKFLSSRLFDKIISIFRIRQNSLIKQGILFLITRIINSVNQIIGDQNKYIEIHNHFRNYLDSITNQSSIQIQVEECLQKIQNLCK